MYSSEIDCNNWKTANIQLNEFSIINWRRFKIYTGNPTHSQTFQVYPKVSDRGRYAPCRRDKLSCFVAAGQPGPAEQVGTIPDYTSCLNSKKTFL